MLSVKDTNNNPFSYGVALDSVKDIQNMLDYVTAILSANYICAQYGIFDFLSANEENRFKEYGEIVRKNCNLPIPNNPNDLMCIWSRLNKNNYEWMYKLWVSLNRNLFSKTKKNHSNFKYFVFFQNSDIYPEDIG